MRGENKVAKSILNDLAMFWTSGVYGSLNVLYSKELNRLMVGLRRGKWSKLREIVEWRMRGVREVGSSIVTFLYG